MSLKIKIDENLISALKEKKDLESLVLRMLKAAINNKEIDKHYRLSKEKSGKDLEEASKLLDEEVIDVISSEIKKRKESVEAYEKGNRPELAAKEKNEIEILQKYLPEQISEEELKKFVIEAIANTGAKEMKDMGKVMADLGPKIKGKADMSLVSKLVKESLIK